MKKVKSFERKFKYILPNILKKIISDLLTNEKSEFSGLVDDMGENAAEKMRQMAGVEV